MIYAKPLNGKRIVPQVLGRIEPLFSRTSIVQFADSRHEFDALSE